MELTIYQIDAFTDKLFSGNPAAVVPLAHWPEDSLMQQIAMENNLSETAFFVKTDAGYHIRWFTPADEIDLCGHATLASAYVIKNFIEPPVKEIHFTTQKAGALTTTCEEGIYTLDFPARMPVACEAPDILLKCLDIMQPLEVLRSRDYMVVLPNEEAVKDIQPDFTLMKQLDTTGVIVTAKGETADVVSRCFYPALGVPEDPVTGSAHCHIVPYWSEKLGKEQLLCRQLSARSGELRCTLQDDRVLMSGNCVLYMEGKLNLDSLD